MSKISRKTSKRKRIIALVLALVMVITPLMSFDGQRQGAKADETPATPYYSVAAFDSSAIVDIDDKNSSADDNVPAISVTPGIIKDVYADLSLTTTSFNFVVDSTKKPSKVTYINQTMEDGGQSAIDSTASNMETSIEYHLTTNATDNGSRGYIKSVDVGTNVTNISVTSGVSNVYVYAKFTITDTSTSTPYTTGYYYKVATFNIVNQASMTGIGWNNADWSKTKTATIQGESDRYYGTTDLHVGTIKYAVAQAKYSEGETPVLITDIAQYTGLSWTGKDATGNITGIGSDYTGEYIIFAGYFLGDNLVYAKASNAGKFDNIEPSSLTVKLLKVPSTTDLDTNFSPEQDGVEVTNGTVVGNDPNVKYIYYVETADANSGIKDVKLYSGSDDKGTFTAGTGALSSYYYLEITDTLMGTSDKGYSIQSSDNAGNIKELDADATPEVLKADSTMADVSYQWSGKDANTSLGEVTQNTKQTLTVSGTTYKEPVKIKIIYGSGSGNIVKDLNVPKNPSDPYYTFTEDIELPASITNIQMATIKVFVLDNTATLDGIWSTPADIGSINYDVTRPVVTWDSSKLQPNTNTTWYNKATTSLDATLNASKETASASYESGLASAQYDITNSASSTTDVSDMDMTIAADKDTATADITIPESKDINGTKVTYEVKDSAGNVASTDDVFYVDVHEPIFIGTPAISNGDKTVNSDADYNTYFKTNPNINVEIKDNIGIKKVLYTVEKNGGAPISYTVEKDPTVLSYKSQDDNLTLQTLLGSEALEAGTYKVTVKAVDIAGNTSEVKTLTFSYDGDAPSLASYSFVKLASDKTDWADATAITDLADPYYINKNPLVDDNQYAFKVVFTDNKSGVDELKVKNASTATWYTVETGTDTADGIIYLVVDKNSLSEYNPKTVDDLVLYDAAGNTSAAQTLAPSLLAVSTNITFTATLMLDGSEVTIDESVQNELKNGTSKNYAVKIEATGSNAFEEVYLKDANGQITNATKVVSVDNVYDSTLKRYTYEATFLLPTSENRKFTDITAYGKDDLDNEKTADLCTILFDKTNPQIENSVPEGWVSAATLGVTANSGSGSVESDIEKAVYSIAGRPDVSFPNIIGVNANTNGVDVLESATTNGTSVVVSVVDVAGNPATKSYTYYVDSTRPVIDTLLVNGNATNVIPLKENPVVTTTVSDNLTLAQVKIEVVYPTGQVKGKTFDFETTDGLLNGSSKSFSYTLEALTGSYAPDGKYSVKISAVDKAGNTAYEKVSTFAIDNTIPVVSVSIDSNTIQKYQSSKNEVYYNGNVQVNFTLAEENLKSYTILDNGNAMEVEWGNGTASALISTEGAHTISIVATDQSDQTSELKSVYFVIDKTVPTVSASVNKLANPSNVVDLMATANVAASIQDASASDLYFQTIVTKPDDEAQTSTYILTETTSFNYDVEADYVVNFFAVDSANNQGPTRSVSFRVDKTAPELTISGVADNGTSVDPVTVNLSVKEAFYKDAEATATIYRKPGDGVPEVLVKTVKMNLTGATTSLVETFSETGTYRIEMEAADRVGHSAKTSHSFTIDKDAPTLSMTGISNYDVTKEDVDFYAEVGDVFYNSKNVTITGTRVDIDGKSNKIEFTNVNPHANPTIISEKFTEEGVYDILISAVDAAGNKKEQSIHFTIDKTAPVIKDLSDYKDKTLTSFDLDLDADDLVTDLTVCNVQIYLNGSEYDGSAIEDGAYLLEIIATDEAGLTTKEEVSFVLDTKKPVFIVTGVEDGEVKNEAYEITVSLQLEEDTLSEVTLNDKVVTIANNQATISVQEKGDYTLNMKAVDAAGNKAEQTISFKYGQEANKLWIIIIAVCSVVLVGGIVIYVVAMKRKKN